MPQLDLTWFLFNFSVAWFLVLLVVSALFSQKWNNKVSNKENTTNPLHSNSNNWRW